jgi:lysyl-tRNA synthetase class 2
MYEFDRRQLQKLEQLRELGIEPYPKGNADTESIGEAVDFGSELSIPELDGIKYVFKLVGRLRFKNEMGKMGFGRIEDNSGRVQFAIRKGEISDEDFRAWKKLDVGDWVYVEGRLGRSSTGQLTLFASGLSLYSKCIEGMPDKVQGITDRETLQRQRYLDLAISEETRQRFATRSKVVKFVRAFLESNGFMEVETPILQGIPGGASAKPFETHHNALDQDLFLRIAPELYLKRLLVGGFPKVFELNRNFRNEGISTKHNPEFTMVEFYAAHWQYENLILVITTLLRSLAETICENGVVEYGEHQIDFSDVRVIRFDDAIASMGVEDPWDVEQLKAFWLDRNPEREDFPDTVGGWFMLLFDTYIEPKLINPTFVTHFPTELSPLARKNDEEPRVTDRFELFIAGQEIANGFNELNDPVDQAERFMQQVEKKAKGDDEAMYFDKDYIRALAYGMPPAAGAGIGIDRLVMLLTNSQNIRDVILFPTLRRA